MRDLDWHELDVYLHEIRRLCSNAISAGQEFNHIVVGGSRDLDSDAAFRRLDDIAVYAGRVCQIFWPTQGNKRRGEVLRTLLDVPDTSPLKDKSLRNGIEHFDEEIDDWVKKSQFKNVVHTMMGGRGSIETDCIFEGDILRWWVDEEKTYILRGREVNLQRLLTELEGIHTSVKSVLSVPSFRREKLEQVLSAKAEN